jgi:hypothetical protein
MGNTSILVANGAFLFIFYFIKRLMELSSRQKNPLRKHSITILKKTIRGKYALDIYFNRGSVKV